MALFELDDDQDVGLLFEEEIAVPHDWEHIVIDTVDVPKAIVGDIVSSVREAGLKVFKDADRLEISRRNGNQNYKGPLTEAFLEDGVLPSLLNDGFKGVEFYDEKGALISERVSRVRSAA